MSPSTSMELAVQRDEGEGPHLSPSESTISLAVYQQLEARNDQLEARYDQLMATSDRDRWPDITDTNGSEGAHQKRRRVRHDIDHNLQCKAWRRWFTARQGEKQDVRGYIAYLDTIVRELYDPPSAAQYYYKLRINMKDSIREILDVQIIQPTTCEDLIQLGLRIEAARQQSCIPQGPAKGRRLGPNYPPSNTRSNSSTDSSTQIETRPKYEQRGGAAPRRARGGRRGRGNSERGGQAYTPDPWGNAKLSPVVDKMPSSVVNTWEAPNMDKWVSPIVDKWLTPVVDQSESSTVDKEEGEAASEGMLCWDCGKPGHVSSACPKVTTEGKSHANDRGATWEQIPSHVERFVRSKEHAAPDESAIGEEGPESMGFSSLSQSKWSTSNYVEVPSLLD